MRSGEPVRAYPISEYSRQFSRRIDAQTPPTAGVVAITRRNDRRVIRVIRRFRQASFLRTFGASSAISHAASVRWPLSGDRRAITARFIMWLSMPITMASGETTASNPSGKYFPLDAPH
jgi:hypothetical protein